MYLVSTVEAFDYKNGWHHPSGTPVLTLFRLSLNETENTCTVFSKLHFSHNLTVWKHPCPKCANDMMSLSSLRLDMISLSSLRLIST